MCGRKNSRVVSWALNDGNDARPTPSLPGGRFPGAGEFFAGVLYTASERMDVAARAINRHV